MTDLLGAIILGLSFGSVYALLSVGLVLTYRTTGIFNLALVPSRSSWRRFTTTRT